MMWETPEKQSKKKKLIIEKKKKHRHEQYTDTKEETEIQKENSESTIATTHCLECVVSSKN